MQSYRETAWNSFKSTRKPMRVEIPPSKAQMMAKAAENSFDGGRTARWMETATIWISIRDASTGHSVNVVSDRSREELMPEIDFGLKLMDWMSTRALTWWWWDQPWIRSLPANVDPGPEHLNGGWAIPGIPEVHVYRREEAHKVLLHEAIHVLLLDVPHEKVEPVRYQFETYLGRQLWPHLGECFTELYAEFLWSIASAASLEDAGRRWTAQLACSAKQAGQVWARIHDAKEDEKTNVFAYYILKWVLMQHDEVMLNPNRTLAFWFDWFLSALPKLNEMSAMVASSENETLNLGMTCPSY